MIFYDIDPNSHIVWVENVDARLKALRDIEAGQSQSPIHVKHSIRFCLMSIMLLRSCLMMWQVKSCGYVTLMQVWIVMLDKIFCPMGLDLSVVALVVC